MADQEQKRIEAEMYSVSVGTHAQSEEPDDTASIQVPSRNEEPTEEVGLWSNSYGEDLDCVGDTSYLPLQRPSSSFYSDSGTGSYYGVGGDGGGGGVARPHT
ncbi:hypothetical protein Pcinc_022584 [Petrolisthes cinctipes]|uniref:Uncharacterized protein n=1 Tax=Petrolisthes cinctipes TaxID=88211 RepID=A0AAE1FDZ3_PETCI|nr:hypothetical protein Pcinc_022584 [Petrolisthes cinctipes]